MATKAPLLTYFGEPKQTNAIQKALNNKLARIPEPTIGKIIR